MKYYISSKMTGLPDLGVEAFRIEAAILRSRGHDIHVPEVRPGIPWHHCMIIDFLDLNRCDGIHLFGPWYRSQGALIELLAAHRMGKDISIAQWWARPIQWIANKTRYRGEKVKD